MKRKLTIMVAMAAACAAVQLAAMPTEKETRRAEPVVRKLLEPERKALRSGKKTRSEVANAAMKLLPPAVKEYVSDTLSLDQASVKILDSEALSADEVKDIDELYTRYFDTEAGYVDAATLVRLEIRIPDKKLTKSLIPLVMIKVDGKWYLDILRTSDEMEDVDWVFGGFNFMKYFNKK